MNSGTAQRPLVGKSGESLKTWIRRQRFNPYPAFRGTGAKVIYIVGNLRAIRIKLPLNFRTGSINGTLFGAATITPADSGIGRNRKEGHKS